MTVQVFGRYHNTGQVGTVAEHIAAHDQIRVIGHADAFQRGTAVKGLIVYILDGVRQDDLIQIFAKTKRSKRQSGYSILYNSALEVGLPINVFIPITIDPSGAGDGHGAVVVQRECRILAAASRHCGPRCSRQQAERHQNGQQHAYRFLHKLSPFRPSYGTAPMRRVWILYYLYTILTKKTICRVHSIRLFFQILHPFLHPAADSFPSGRANRAVSPLYNGGNVG